MIHLFTDFGLAGPYVGEMTAAALRVAPGVPVVNLMADAPAFSPRPAAYLLAALVGRIGAGEVLLAVVDPGVGGSRLPVAVRADGVWLVGPDNGLFELVLRRAKKTETYAIAWRPERLSASFHGRDLFAPVAARLALGEDRDLTPHKLTRQPDWPDDLPEVIYADRYGNAVTGLRGEEVDASAVLHVAGRRLGFARTFSAARPGEPFWYVNSSGLVEIAVDRDSAVDRLGLQVGSLVALA